LTTGAFDVHGFWIHEPGRIRLLTPYVERFVDQLKERVPYRSLTWDKEARTWIVRAPFIDTALELAHETYDSMTQLYLTETAPSAAAGHAIEECLRRVRAMYAEEATLYVLPGAPLAVTQAAYRALALLVHPDRGGSHEEMVAVNRAYDVLRRRAEGRTGQ